MFHFADKLTVEKTEGVIKNGQSIDTVNIGHTNKTEKHN